MNAESQWHLSKRISIETVVIMLVQTVALVWFASKMDSRVENLENNQVTALTMVERITKLESEVENLGDLVQVQSSVINRIDRKLPTLKELEQVQ
jgi:hypothetical protein